MKSKTLSAIAVAGALCSTGAYAGSGWNGHEVQTPSSVSESAPWLAHESHMPLSASSVTFARTPSEQSGFGSYAATGASSSVVGSGSIGSDSSMSAPLGDSKSMRSDSSMTSAHTEYWLLGADRSEVGASSGVSGSGSVGFDSARTDTDLQLDSSMSAGELATYSFEPAGSAFEMVLFTPSAEQVVADIGDATPLLSRHYLIPAPGSAYDPSEFAVLAIGPASEDLALLDSLKEHFIILTPAYGEA